MSAFFAKCRDLNLSVHSILKYIKNDNIIQHLKVTYVWHYDLCYNYSITPTLIYFIARSPFDNTDNLFTQHTKILLLQNKMLKTQ